MSITTVALLEFLRRHRYGVEASHGANGPPQAALIGFVINENFELFFDSFDSTRKVANLRRDPHVAFVIGGHEAGDERTVQYEGEVDEPTDAELEHLKRCYFAVHPDGLRRSKLAGITYFRVRARWIRYTDFNAIPPEIVVFNDADLSVDKSLAGSSPTKPYTEMREPWQPDIERAPVFHSFANPRGFVDAPDSPSLERPKSDTA